MMHDADIARLLGESAPAVPRDLDSAYRAGLVASIAHDLGRAHDVLASRLPTVAPEEWTPQMLADLAELCGLVARLRHTAGARRRGRR